MVYVRVLCANTLAHHYKYFKPKTLPPHQFIEYRTKRKCKTDASGMMRPAASLCYWKSAPVGTQGPRDSKITTQNSHILRFIC